MSDGRDPAAPITLADSHCHLDRLDYASCGGSLESAVAAAAREGVERILCVGIERSQWPGMLSVVERFAGVHAAIGVHPSERDEDEVAEEELVAALTHPKVVAVGETGLDYYRNAGDMRWQQERFARHIAAARRAGLPLVVHSRAASDDTLAMLSSEEARAVGGVMHCFADDWARARDYLDLGFYISLSGIVTFRNAESMREVARKVPLDRLLIETDAPYLAPVPHRGKPNQPAYVRHVAACIADERGLALAEVARATTENYLRLFPRAA